MTQPAEPQGGQPAPEPPPSPAATPPWGEDFDAEKAWKLVQNLRDENKGLKSRPVLDDAAKARLDEYDRLKAASQTDLEKAQSELSRWQTEAETWRTASVASKIEALAATDFEFPADAVNALKDKNYLDSGGTISEDAIKADLAGLLEARPNWRRGANTTATRVPAPNRAQGSGAGAGSGGDPAQEFAAILNGQLK